MQADNRALYFFSRVHIFTPATANYLMTEPAYHILTRAQLAAHIVDTARGGGPQTIDQIMRADNNHGGYWPLEHVHRISDDHSFLTAETDRVGTIKNLLTTDAGMGYSSFTDDFLWKMIDEDWSRPQLLPPPPDLQKWAAELGERCNAAVKAHTWPETVYAEGTFWQIEGERFADMSGGQNLIDVAADYFNALIAHDLNDKKLKDHRTLMGVSRVEHSWYGRFAGALFRALLKKQESNSRTHTGLSLYGYSFLHAGDAVKGASYLGNVAEVADKIVAGLPLEPIGPSDFMSDSRWPPEPGRPLHGLTKLDRALEKYQEPPHPYPLCPVPRDWVMPRAALLECAKGVRPAGNPAKPAP
jgi:hypothetical protein